jgi:hypothetical protein
VQEGRIHTEYVPAYAPDLNPVEYLVPRLIVAFGTRRERYDTAFQMQCYSGIAPVKEASGNSRWVHFRRSCPKFLRQTFHEFAFLSTRSSVWAKAYYDRQREQDQSHPAAIRALAYKWIRIIFRCWKERQPYDEQIYLQSLQKRRSPLGPPITALGRFEVYVRPFIPPDPAASSTRNQPAGLKQQVSKDGAVTRPVRWSADGKELFFQGLARIHNGGGGVLDPKPW